MTKRIFITPRANLDIDEHVSYLLERNDTAALRLFDAIRLTAAQIARMPSIGHQYSTEIPDLKELRKIPVKSFKNYLIFYFVEADTIRIVRLLYAAQDISSILEETI